jgi:hypothetical protein
LWRETLYPVGATCVPFLEQQANLEIKRGT